jgi:Domain of unknown function (DUF4263)
VIEAILSSPMSKPETARDILDVVFSTAFVEPNAELVALEQSPTYGEVLDFAELIANEPSEEELQSFISSHPRLLMGIFGFSDDSILAVIAKPSIGGHFFADFGVLLFGQGGCTVALVELEPVNARIFTKRLSPASRYQQSIAQVQEWNDWIRRNIRTFVEDTVTGAMLLPLFPEKSHNGSFRTKPSQFIQEMWRGFGGFDDPYILNTIVIGRWSKLGNDERLRFLSNNRHNSKLYQTYTYEQIIRRGIERPYGKW